MEGKDAITAAYNTLLQHLSGEQGSEETLEPITWRLFIPKTEYSRMIRGQVQPIRIFIRHTIENAERSFVLREINEDVPFVFGTQRTAIKVKLREECYAIYWLEKCLKCKYLIIPGTSGQHWPCQGLSNSVLELSGLLQKLHTILPSGTGRENTRIFCGTYFVPKSAAYVNMVDPFSSGHQ